MTYEGDKSIRQVFHFLLLEVLLVCSETIKGRRINSHTVFLHTRTVII